CGEAHLTSRQKIWQDAERLRRDADPKHGNVNLRISDITDKMAASLPKVAADLIEVATYIYCADQAIGRGGPAEFEYGEKWRRSFRFEIPVRCPQVWTSSPVIDVLKRTLSFLSDDDYDFGFAKLTKAPPLARDLEFDQKTPQV